MGREKKKERMKGKEKKETTQTRLHTLYRNQLKMDYRFKCKTGHYKTPRGIHRKDIL